MAAPAMKVGAVVKKKPKMGISLSVATPEQMQSFVVDQHGKFQHGKIVIDNSGLKKSDELDDGMTLKAEELELLEILGKGASSVVQKARNMRTGVVMALKIINVFDKEKRHQLMKEIRTLHQANCPDLVTFYGAFFKEGQISLGLELMDRGSLHDVLEKVGPFPESALALISRQILNGLSYLHKERHAIHRDIKPSNICLNSRGQAKLTDFGVAAELHDSVGHCETFVGTFCYMSPERVSGKGYSFNSDIWSYGLCVLECALGKFPYPSVSVYFEMVQAIVNDAPPQPDPSVFSPGFCDFIAQCLHKDPAQRANAADLMRHPWVTDPVHDAFSIAEWLASNDC